MADEKRTAARRKMELFRKEGETDVTSKRFGINCDFICEAVEVELQCRRLLKVSVARATLFNIGSTHTSLHTSSLTEALRRNSSFSNRLTWRVLQNVLLI